MPARATRTNSTGGRPKKADGESRCVVAGIRMTLAEREHARQQARQADLSLSEFLRRRALSLPVVVRQATTDARLIHELNAIGVNLNQIARNMNADRMGVPGSRAVDLDDLQAHLRRTLDQVVDAFHD